MGLALASCATPRGETPAPAVPTEVERQCLAALTSTGDRLKSDEFSGCERGLDCRAIAPLVSGRCGAFVNAAAFDARLDEFEGRVAACRAVVQVVPHCPQLRPVCRDSRCEGETVSELPEECSELTTALEAEARTASGCEADSECTVLDEIATTVKFVSASLDRQEQRARACGKVPPPLYTVRTPRPEAFCVTGRCVSERSSPQFTTVVRARTGLTPPELDHECIKEKFLASFRDPDKLLRRPTWELSYVASLDTEGRQNQFEFLVPAGLSAPAQQAFASRLSECRASRPALLRGKPIAIRNRFTIRWVVK